MILRKKAFGTIMEQEGQNGPSWLRWVFEITLAIFFFVPFREEFTRISLCLYSASNPLYYYHVYWQIKISQTIFEKGQGVRSHRNVRESRRL